MLGRPDAAVARRDPTVAGLATILDPEAVGAWLRRELPDATITGVTARYVRYKPRTSCIVAYDLLVDGQHTWGYAKAHRDPEKAAKARQWAHRRGPCGPGAVVDESLALAFVFAPNDRRISAFGALGPGSGLRRRLLRGRPELWEVPVRILVHKPERRAVLRVVGPDGTGAVLRCYTGDDHARALAGARAAAAAAVATGQPLGSDPGRAALALSWRDGVALDLVDPAAAAQVALVGEAAGRLHLHPPDGLPLRGDVAAAQELRAAADATAAVVPSVGERARRLAHRLSASAPGPRTVATLHGDLSADQVIVDEAGVALLDFDEVAAGDPAVDLGRFLATADADVLRGRLPAARRDAAVVALLEGHASAAPGVVDPFAIAHHRAAALLMLAAEPFRYRDPEWPVRIAALVARAEAIAGAAPLAGRRAALSS